MSVAARPCREELEALVRHYHHVESEHERAHPEGTVRHHLEVRLREDRERFEHLLATYVPDAESRSAWQAYLHHRGAEPPGPPAINPLVFKGRSETGSIVEIRNDTSGGLGVDVDGHLVERLAAEHAPIAEGPASFRLDGTEFRELFDAQPSAMRALRDFLSAGGSPPWRHASELLADGLIDVNFGLTARGRRALPTGITGRR
jgi:hypothetical protein